MWFFQISSLLNDGLQYYEHTPGSVYTVDINLQGTTETQQLRSDKV